MTVADPTIDAPLGTSRSLLPSRVLAILNRRRRDACPGAARRDEALRLEVVSMVAAVAGHVHGITWKGEVALSELRRYLPAGVNMTRPAMNAAIFRFFTRAGENDSARLEAIGYRLPSLSTGDLVTIETVTFLVAPAGFQRVTDNTQFAGFLLGRSPER